MEEAKMSLQAKKELIYRMRWQYAEADRKGKTEIIDGVIAATGYHRKYAIAALRKPVQRLRALRKPQKVYDDNVREVLVQIWNAANQICSKRLAPFIPEFLEALERFGHLAISTEVREKLLSMSPATIDRILKNERSKRPYGRSTTRPGNLLKQRIKVKTFADWNEAEPGFFEGDLVAHCGERVDGSFLNTLVLTDISSCWTEFAPLLRKSDADVTAAMTAIRAVLPITMLGVDTDNGSEFINEELFNYCEREQITFTRSRPYKKNDQAHVEQKNGNLIRRTVGYDRFEGVDSWNRLMELYRILRLYINFFQPSCKLLKKVRTGSRVSKQYDKAQTPYRRLMGSEKVTAECKRKLTELYSTLDPIALFEQIAKLQAQLLATAVDGSAEAPPGSNSASLPTLVLYQEETSDLHTLKPLTGKRTYRKRKPHSRQRTRKDPLEGAAERARQIFEADHCITGAALLKKLQEEFPDKFTGAELKTVQRRLAAWRREKINEHQTANIRGTTYDVLLCRETLAHSSPLSSRVVCHV
jgi:hypothetical protein